MVVPGGDVPGQERAGPRQESPSPAPESDGFTPESRFPVPERGGFGQESGGFIPESGFPTRICCVPTPETLAFRVGKVFAGPMKVVLNLKELTEAETLTLASTVISDLTGNAAFTPKPTLAALGALQTTAQQSANAVAAARQALALAVVNKDAAFAALRAGLTDEAATVEAAAEALPAGQQEAAILSAGMAPAERADAGDDARGRWRDWR